MTVIKYFWYALSLTQTWERRYANLLSPTFLFLSDNSKLHLSSGKEKKRFQSFYNLFLKSSSAFAILYFKTSPYAVNGWTGYFCLLYILLKLCRKFCYNLRLFPNYPFRGRESGSFFLEKYWSWVGGIVNVVVQMRGDSPGSTLRDGR